MSDVNEETRRIRGSIPDIPRRTRWGLLWSRFWAIPAASVLAAIVAGSLLPRWERALGEPFPFVFEGGPDAAREVLGTIASSTISVTGLTFSITLVVLQLVSSQFSPRMLSGFLASRVVQATLGIFLGTFIYSLTVLRSVLSEDEDIVAFVPRASVTLSFLLVLGCVGLFLAFIHLITSSMQVSRAISEIGEETMRLAKRLYPVSVEDAGPIQGPGWSPRPGDPRTHVTVEGHGSLVWINYRKLMAWADRHDAVMTIDRTVGDYLVAGQPLLSIWWEDEPSESDLRQIHAAFELRTERERHQDIAFGLRQLVDIADRALSPGVNDPATAVQAVQELHRIFRYLVTVVEPSPYMANSDGEVRVVHQPQSVADMLDEVVYEVHFYGQNSAMIPGLLRNMVDDLETAATGHIVSSIQKTRRILEDEKAESE
ncbi:DUF2254 domain-containing protein [Flaviflexus huanghaiensis]|uniref:DUF2254 domain-containing protein n=1 Tax=Flaviflexus huanghaiensis TaxID=1111473 RepID=UPI0015FCBDF1|nr:DUF2254 family protein [Flaviflexus huanghaiensis]